MSTERFRDYAAGWWTDQKATLRLLRRWWLLALLILLALGIRAEFRLHFESRPTTEAEP